MENQQQQNWGAPPATDASGDMAASQPVIPPAADQSPQPAESASEATPPAPDTLPRTASEPSPWPSIPDETVIPNLPPQQSAGDDMPTLPGLPPQQQQPAPAITGTPGTPGAFPPTYPAYSAPPSAPLQPGASGMSGMPSGYPAMPMPSRPLYPGAQPPAQPSWGPSLPPTYPAYPAYPGNEVPAFASSLPFAPSLPLRPARYSRLERAFPFWLSLLLTVGALLVTAAVYVADVAVAHADWSNGARAAGITAFALAGATLLLLVVRLSLGRRATSTILLSLLLAVLLMCGGVGGLAFANPLHSYQAQSLERSGDWSGAIYEYGLTGESAPNAPDIARVYDEWGEQLLQQKSYKPAAMRFMTVITEYGQSGAAVGRAQTDLFNTYLAWVPTNDPTLPYSDAIATIVAYRSGPQCDAACQTNARAVEAQARYQYGSQLLAQHQYTAAIQQLEMVQTQFASSPYAKPAHLAAAQAYYALGQQQLQSACSDAIPTYQKLAKQYADTPEGARAKAALSAPQSVVGNISGFTDPTRIVYLSRSVNPSAFYFSQDYRTSVDGQGNFTFRGVAQGKYNLSAASYVSGSYIIYPYWSDGQNLYSVQVGPLCPTQIGRLTFK